MNGSPNVDAGTSQAAVVHGLTPDTSYEITVKARDFYGPNWSEPSQASTVRTPRRADDTEPPSPPGDLTAWDLGCGEVHLFWTESFDDQTPQAALQYTVSVNDVFDHTMTGSDRTILYGTRNGDNTFTVMAVDSADLRSEPVSTTLILDLCQPVQ